LQTTHLVVKVVILRMGMEQEEEAFGIDRFQVRLVRRNFSHAERDLNTLLDENFRVKHNKAGLLASANRGPNSNSSQVRATVFHPDFRAHLLL